MPLGQSIFGSYVSAVAVAGTLALSMTVPTIARAADSSNDLPPDREEIIVTHSRLGPLSDWAQMQAHEAEYQRLKAKFQPTEGSNHVDNWASDRAAAQPTAPGQAFVQENADQPTAPAVQAIKDAIVPP
jgi:hypothetical protein